VVGDEGAAVPVMTVEMLELSPVSGDYCTDSSSLEAARSMLRLSGGDHSHYHGEEGQGELRHRRLTMSL